MMDAHQFIICEHASYDMVWTWVTVANSIYGGKQGSSQRIREALDGVITPIMCRFFLLPDYQFNVHEFSGAPKH